MVNVPPLPLYPPKNPVPTELEAGWAQSQSGHFGDKEKFLAPDVIIPLIYWVIQKLCALL